MASSLAQKTRHRAMKYMLCLILVLILVVTVISHYYLNAINGLPNYDPSLNPLLQDSGDRPLDLHIKKSDDLTARLDGNGLRFEQTVSLEFKSHDLESRVKELLSIRSSVRNELRQLEAKRRDLLQEIAEYSNKLEAMRTQLAKKSAELDRVQLSLEQTKYAQKEVLLKSNALLVPPLQLLPSLPQTNELAKAELRSSSVTLDRADYRMCRMHNCFDYSRCSLYSPFLLYFYHPEDEDIDDTLDSDNREDKRLATDSERIRSQIVDSFNGNPHVTFDPTVACVYVVILFNNNNVKHFTKDYLNHYFHSLPFWAGDGRNHIVINMLNHFDLQSIEGLELMKAMLIQTNFRLDRFRQGFDVIVPEVNHQFYADHRPDFSEVPTTLCPARRKYLATYLGAIDDRNTILNTIQQSLLKMSTHSANNNELLFDFVCDDKTRRLCDNQTLILRQSTFALILPPNDTKLIFSSDLSKRLIDVLSSGAIPVIIGGDYLRLPFDEVLDWRLAAIHLPIARTTELHFLLRSFSDSDLQDLRRNGQLYLSRHLWSIEAIISSTVALVRQSRLQIPSFGARDEQSIALFNASNPIKFFDSTSGLVLIDINGGENDENLGPIEPPFPSQTYQRNYSLAINQGYRLWNDHRFDPFTTYPSLPWDPLLTSDAKFIGSSYGFRPIGGGAGGAGKEFSEALGGNVPKEQFTIVMLTYEREAVLIDSLQRLKGLPHLNKVLVIWNSARPPSPDLRWPSLGAPLRVIRAQHNSLNNRFIPYSDIETDAILSMDDDAHLRHDEIVFGFRVWREARDRIVGFPGRYHAWDPNPSHQSFLYNSNYSCELSMVLTGAAFFHKYYSYLYTHSMSGAIRAKVDEYMNCEDIAMNFLVAHISRQPPIKVTSRWTFRCAGCPVSLSEDDSHFNERHKCINYFVEVYGYMPLLNTQFRADSVLFKTRIPHDKQKCFKFI